MKINITQNTEEWLAFRRGKITGSKVKAIVTLPNKTQQAVRLLKQGLTDEEVAKRVSCSLATVKKARNVKIEEKRSIEFYQLIADRIATVHEGDPMERGHELESVAISLYEEKHDTTVESGMMYVSDDNENIALSPDGIAGKTGIEVKCLKSARHLQAYFEQTIPNEYMPQIYQYFIVIPELEAVDMVFYDPNIPLLPYHEIRVERKDHKQGIDIYKQEQIRILEEVDKLIESLI